jgi:hypothetical protein
VSARVGDFIEAILILKPGSRKAEVLGSGTTVQKSSSVEVLLGEIAGEPAYITSLHFTTEAATWHTDVKLCSEVEIGLSNSQLPFICRSKNFGIDRKPSRFFLPLQEFDSSATGAAQKYSILHTLNLAAKSGGNGAIGEFFSEDKEMRGKVGKLWAKYLSVSAVEVDPESVLEPPVAVVFPTTGHDAAGGADDEGNETESSSFISASKVAFEVVLESREIYSAEEQGTVKLLAFKEKESTYSTVIKSSDGSIVVLADKNDIDKSKPAFLPLKMVPVTVTVTDPRLKTLRDVGREHISLIEEMVKFGKICATSKVACSFYSSLTSKLNVDGNQDILVAYIEYPPVSTARLTVILEFSRDESHKAAILSEPNRWPVSEVLTILARDGCYFQNAVLKVCLTPNVIRRLNKTNEFHAWLNAVKRNHAKETPRPSAFEESLRELKALKLEKEDLLVESSRLQGEVRTLEESAKGFEKDKASLKKNVEDLKTRFKELESELKNERERILKMASESSIAPTSFESPQPLAAFAAPHHGGYVIKERPRPSDDEDAKKAVVAVNVENSELLSNPTVSAMVRGLGLHMSEKLYPSELSILNELVQNADDCQFHADAVPTVTIVALSDKLEVGSNEEGLTPSNILAMSQWAQSDKTFGDTGRKGLGFKSVYKLGKHISIDSRHIHFDFDDKDGEITPRMLPKVRAGDFEDGTRISISSESLLVCLPQSSPRLSFN